MSNINRLKLPFGYARYISFLDFYFFIIQADFDRNCPRLLLKLYKALGLFVIRQFLQRCYLFTTVRCLLIRVTCEFRLH